MGKRPPIIFSIRSVRDHPHACGEKHWGKPDKIIASGSSPRVWGKALERFCEAVKRRIIPTRVGKSAPQLKPITYAKDHPHACGEKPLCTTPTEKLIGSSPRVWGKGRRVSKSEGEGRIIPTRVGKRQGAFFVNQMSEDHPHACGEKCALIMQDQYGLGSSPRVWGKVHILICRHHILRIIPTRVGKRCLRIGVVDIIRDHPHACGEKSSR